MTDQMSGAPSTQERGASADAAKGVAERGAERASEVAGEAMAEARTVARDAKEHVRELVDRSRQDIGDEAAARSRQAAGTVRTFADRMGALANGDPQNAGPLADLAREGQERLSAFAARLDEGPSAVLDDVRRFARRQPMLFLATAGVVGFVAGRLVRAGREAEPTAPGGTGRAEPLPPPATPLEPTAATSPPLAQPPTTVVP